MAKAGAFALYLSDDILNEVTDVLTTHPRIRRRYRYPDAAIVEYRAELARFAEVVGDIPEIRAVRDPSDDKIVACAVAAAAAYLVTRDKDLLSLANYRGTSIIPPENFLRVLKQAP